MRTSVAARYDGLREKHRMSEAIISLKIERLAGGGFLATSHVLPGLVAQGSTLVDTIHIAKQAARRIVDGCFERGERIPVAAFAERAIEVGVAIELPEAAPAPPPQPNRRRGEID